MSDLTKANNARLNAALDKRYNFSHGIDTFRGMIAKGFFSSAESRVVPRVTYDRRKFNRMNHAEQRAYELRLKETKTEFSLTYAADPDRCAIVPKMVFDYFNALNKESENV